MITIYAEQGAQALPAPNPLRVVGAHRGFQICARK